jgi:hypothetical protein
MINQLVPRKFSAAVDRSNGERVVVGSGDRPCQVTFIGDVPADLVAVVYDAMGQATTQEITPVPGESYTVLAADLVITHGPKTNGQEFRLVVGYGTARLRSASRFMQAFMRVGPKATDVVPRRIGNVYKGGKLTFTAANTPQPLWTPNLGRRIRLLRAVFDMSGASTVAANTACDFTVREAGPGATLYVLTTVVATAVSTSRQSSGVIEFGDGFLMQPNTALEGLVSVAGNIIYNFQLLGCEE